VQPTHNALSDDIRAQYAELLNLATTIDRHAELQQLCRNAPAGLSFITMHTLFDAVPPMEEDYSDLSPSPPHEETAWRGAKFRARRNAISLAFNRSQTS
jgi:hypothetical protein